ncbi:DUF305 domain-containing protein [Erythrobacter arachoides]|uniref:DUF305 domain-containing protein n=1 Tax=Aurantiacibacter arachoides TaxID=1850444 RepID=A0A845A1N0_9SPHN|nr:DUF305 domain-containing protein [Aurantiacibacter arachoides]MXO94453.1 DUF305 domain-containing protein [Aurantiacibacter arachoides]GGD63323.1 hypothetical protein GCM10011411_24540 [Aurantiacibacter arachoides]
MDDGKQMQHGSYARFRAMVGTSTVIMFGLMYLNTYALDHVYFSETRFWMMFVMGSVMALVMLAFMWGMYRSTAKNWIIVGVAVAVFAGSLWLVRSQQSVDDAEWMRAMIPHHSIAIMTSERAQISDRRVQQLADSIITAQRKEIAEMQWLLDDIARNGETVTDAEAAGRPIPAMGGWLNADGGATP